MGIRTVITYKRMLLPTSLGDASQEPWSSHSIWQRAQSCVSHTSGSGFQSFFEHVIYWSYQNGVAKGSLLFTCLFLKGLQKYLEQHGNVPQIVHSQDASYSKAGHSYS